MSTHVSTDLPTEVSEQLQTAFAAAQTTLEQRTKESYERMLAATMQREQEIIASWERPILQLTQALPEWIYPYIQQPDEKYWEHYLNSVAAYTYVPINVPGCNPIAAWISPNTNGVRFEVLEPQLRCDIDGDNLWYVSTAVKEHRLTVEGISYTGDPDIAITLFRAHDAYLKHLDLVAQAEERNTYEAETLLVAAPEQEPTPEPATPDPIDQARQLVNMLTNNMPVKHIMGSDDESDQADCRTLVLAGVGLAIAYHISRVADALEEK